MSFVWSKIPHRFVAGTASEGANLDRPKHWCATKEWSSCYSVELLGQPTGEGSYVEAGDVLREGVNFPQSEQSFETGQPTYIDTVCIDTATGLCVTAYADAGNSNKGTAIVTQKKGTDAYPDKGTAVVFNNATTTDISICKLSSTTVAISYCDDGGSDYICAIIGTVTESTLTIAFGTEKELTDIASTKTEGTGICEPRDGVIAVAWSAGATSGIYTSGEGYVIAATFSGTTIATPGTAVEFGENEADMMYIDCCSHANGAIAVAYQALTTSNDPVRVNIGTVSSAAVVAFAGSVESMNAAAATSITIKAWATNVLAISWIAGSDAYLIAGTVSSTTVTQGTAIAVNSGTCLTPHFDILDDTHLIYVFEDDVQTAPADPLAAVKITRSTTTLTAGNTDFGTEASTAAPKVAAINSGEFIVYYDDVGASNVGNMINGECRSDMLDVRSSTASAVWRCCVVPLYEYEQIDTGY